MPQSDNPINANAWYFRVADVFAPVMIAGSSAVAVFALANLFSTF